jgi:hypothetical protein
LLLDPGFNEGKLLKSKKWSVSSFSVRLS